MANTYSQIYIQTVFAVDGRLSLIRPEFKEELYKYITGIVRNQSQKLIAINGMSDHVHILIGLKPAIALADWFARSKPILLTSLIERNGCAEGSVGRKATVRSLTGIRSLAQSFATFRIRNYIIDGERSKMSICCG